MNTTLQQVLCGDWLGPYPGHLLDGQWNGYARPLFDLDTVWQIATDTQADIEEYGLEGISVVLIDPDTLRVSIVDGDNRDEEPEGYVVAPDANGLYAIGTDGWTWSLA